MESEELPMRPLPSLILTLAFLTGPFAAGALAQSPALVRPSSRSVAAEPDFLRPYASRSAHVYTSERSARASSRSRPLPPPQRAYAAVVERGVKDYFHDIRPGTSPNRNTVDPKSLCVPGRRALILTGR